jgi:hypothetical protein
VERDGEVEGSQDGRVGRGRQVEKDHGLIKFSAAMHITSLPDLCLGLIPAGVGHSGVA